MKLSDAFKGKYKDHSPEIKLGSLAHMGKLGESTDTNSTDALPPTSVPDVPVSPSSTGPINDVKVRRDSRPAYIISIELAQDDCHLLCMFLIIFTLSLLLSKK